MRTSTLTRTATLVAAVLLAACETATLPAPEADFDPEAALTDYEAMESALSSDDLAAFRALEDRTPFGSSPAAIDAMTAFVSVGGDGDRTGGERRALALARVLLASTASGDGPAEGPAAAPIISGWHRGTTFVYDPEVDEYRPDWSREGAPETGVRFILYDTDDSGTPIPDVEVGYADLVDEGDGSVEDVVLRLQVVVDGATVLDYRITLDREGEAGTLTVQGHLVGDGVRLDFDVALALERIDGEGRAELDFEIGVADRAFSVAGSVTGIEEQGDGMGSIDLEVRHRAHVLVVEMTAEGGTLDGTVFIDDVPFATVSGPVADPVLADAEGGPLSVRELRTLRRVVRVVTNVFHLLETILDPVDDLILLGFIL